MTKAERREMMLEVVENQIRENDPPETKTTLERLIAAGNDRQEAMRLIGCMLATEMFEMLKHQRPFDRKLYVERLHALPEMPWGEGEE